MGKRFDMMLFPGGKDKAFTLSYDDGVKQDRRLAELFRSHGLKCSFNLGYGVLGHEERFTFPGKKEVDMSKLLPEDVAEVYRGHEICGHGLYHSALDSIGTPLAMYEVIEDKRQLETLAGKPLRMFAYPFGVYDQDARDILRLAGYQGARTVKSTYSFDLPGNFLQWDPTCHHGDPRLMELAQQFLEGFAMAPRLFYVWGHGYEFDMDDNWDVIEKLADFMAPHGDTVWFATNGEIMEYVHAYNRLEYSADGSMIYNPSVIDVEIRTGWDGVVLKAGQVTHIEPTPL